VPFHQGFLPLASFIVLLQVLMAAPAADGSHGSSWSHSGDATVPSQHGGGSGAILAEQCQGLDNESVILGHSIACTADGGVTVTENGHARMWPISGDTLVSQVRLGVDACRDASGQGRPCPIEVRLYSAPDFPQFDTAMLLASADMDVPDGTEAAILFAEFDDVPIPDGTNLVIELYNDDGFRGNWGFWPGANDGGQFRPSFIRTRACGPEDWTDLQSLGYADQHNVLCWNDEPSRVEKFCGFLVKKNTKPKGGCIACPRRNDVYTSGELCETVEDCPRKLKVKRLDCPGGGDGFCKKFKAIREGCTE